MAEMISVICSPDIRKSKLPQTVSQRNWYLNIMALPTSSAALESRLSEWRYAHAEPVALEAARHGATIGSSLCFLAYFISRPSSLMVSTNRLM